MLTASNRKMTYTMYGSTNFSFYATDLPFSTITTTDSESPVQIACGHVFGENFLAKWFNTNSTCPICRQQPRGHETPRTRDSRNQDHQWHNAVEYDWLETDFDPEAETAQTESSRRFAKESHPVFTSQNRLCHRNGDIWLTYVYEEQAMPCIPDSSSLLKHSLTPFEHEPNTSVFDESFKELTECHEEWMAEALKDCETDDEEELYFYDVYPC
jgi:hypothetical protein